uniref:Odorant receptor n=1 Tax=Apolygus lucorum TaxID=248454 RepID=A0A1Q1NIQ2_APOLU|nr:olfactory receptor [Apolygus lucorum]
MLIHSDIDKYIKFMKGYCVWYGKSVTWDDTRFDLCRKYYTESKCYLSAVLLCVVSFALYSTDDFGLQDGTFIYWPICLMMLVLTSIATATRHQQDVLTMSLNDNFLENTESWMRAIKDQNINRLWKMLRFYTVYNNTISALYMLVPLVVDSILHYGFDYLQTPFTLALPLTPLLKYSNTWNAQYYVLTAFNFWSCAEMVFMLEWFLGNYLLLTTFFLTELIILKHQVKSLDFGKNEEWDQQVESIVNKHSKIMKLNVELRDYLGLPGAFISFFSSILLTFTAFVSFTSTSIPLRVSYGSGFVLYFGAALLLTTIGQKLENESDELFKAFYSLRWYQYSPNARKSLNMMMRQARTPLIIDFHGRYKMNLANFMQILRSSYSYFTLLREVAKE